MSSTNKWPIVKLGEVAEILMGQAPPSSATNKDRLGYPLIAGAGDFSSTGIEPIKFTNVDARLSEADDIIISIRATIGPFRIADRQYALGRGVAAIRACDKVDNSFLAHYIRYSEPALIMKGRGATFLQISRRDLSGLDVPLPPLAEQQRIAEILDQSQSLINDSLILEEKSETLLKASFIAAFGHPLDPANPINRQRVGAVSKVITGNTPPRKDPSNYGSTVEWLKSDNLGGLQPTPAAELLSDVGARKARLVEPGATLITCIAGSRESIGKSSLLDRTAAFNQQINAIVPGEELDPLFLFAQVKTAPELIRREATDGMKGIVSKKTLESVKILVPSVHAQRQFSEAATKFMSLKDYTQRRTSELRTLHESLSTRAFAGQL